MPRLLEKIRYVGNLLILVLQIIELVDTEKRGGYVLVKVFVGA